MTYLDTSALVKRFVWETGSNEVQSLLTGDEPVASATIAYAELYSGLTRRRREGASRRLNTGSRAGVLNGTGWRSSRWNWAPRFLSLARDLILRHGLRAFDAIHLASALGLQAAANEPVTFVAADQCLLQAAAAEQLATVNPESRDDR